MYHDHNMIKKVVDNIIAEDGYVYLLIPHSQRVKLVPKFVWTAQSHVVKQIHSVYGAEVLRKNDT